MSSCSNDGNIEATDKLNKKLSQRNKERKLGFGDVAESYKGINVLNTHSYRDIYLPPSEFVEVIKKRKTKVTKVQNTGDLTYYATALPKEYMVCNQLRINELSKVEFDSVARDYGEISYYLLEIETKDQQELARFHVAGQAEYTERIKYLSFEMEKYISINGQDQLSYPCVLFHYERTYNASPKNTFLLGFELPNNIKESELQLVIDDQLFNQGYIKFLWHPEDVTHLPKVKLS